MKAFGKEGDLCVNLFMARDDDDDDDMYRGNVLIRFYGPSTVKQDEEIERKSKAPDFILFFCKTVHLHFLRNLADMSLSARKD